MMYSANGSHSNVHFPTYYRHDILLASRDALNKDAKRLRVDLQAIKKFDADLGAQLENNPAEFLPLVQTHTLLLYPHMIIQTAFVFNHP